MRRLLLPAVLALAACPPASSMEWTSPSSLVRVSVDVDGRPTPLYTSADGSGRLYVEARPGSRYAVRIENRTSGRLGVALVVDGLNAISGSREQAGSGQPGRMYVLDPWSDVRVQGWRTNLDEVRQFTFVDERASYSARVGKANGKMGWIEVAVYRELAPPPPPPMPYPVPEMQDKDESSRDQAPGSDREAADAKTAQAAPPASAAGGVGRRAQSYPGTGWGSRQSDPVRLVSFTPEGYAAEVVTMRYEYAGALRALGILPAPYPDRTRLSQRERGVDGFAPPPVY